MMIGYAAQARRFYHHVLYGGKLKPHDVSSMVKTIEKLEQEVSDIQETNEQLLTHLSRMLMAQDGIPLNAIEFGQWVDEARNYLTLSKSKYAKVGKVVTTKERKCGSCGGDCGQC